MISNINTIANEFVLPITFIATLLIFIGTFYVAMFNKNLKQWHVTPLWYVGLSALFVTLSILVQWTTGSDNPLSYDNVGLMGTTFFVCTVASISTIMLVGTVRLNFKLTRKK